MDTVEKKIDPEVAPVVQRHNHDFLYGVLVFFFQFLVSEIR